MTLHVWVFHETPCLNTSNTLVHEMLEPNLLSSLLLLWQRRLFTPASHRNIRSRLLQWINDTQGPYVLVFFVRGAVFVGIYAHPSKHNPHVVHVRIEF